MNWDNLVVLHPLTESLWILYLFSSILMDCTNQILPLFNSPLNGEESNVIVVRNSGLIQFQGTLNDISETMAIEFSLKYVRFFWWICVDPFFSCWSLSCLLVWLSFLQLKFQLRSESIKTGNLQARRLFSFCSEPFNGILMDSWDDFKRSLKWFLRSLHFPWDSLGLFGILWLFDGFMEYVNVYRLFHVCQALSFHCVHVSSLKTIHFHGCNLEIGCDLKPIFMRFESSSERKQTGVEPNKSKTRFCLFAPFCLTSQVIIGHNKWFMR